MPPRPAADGPSNTPAPPLRIIGGEFRGSILRYSGDLRTRPMKDRVREAVFNLLSTYCKGMHAVDLFAGTGALGLEALSRGALRATLLERHFPTARIIEENVRHLHVEERARVIPGDSFIWARKAEPDVIPWLIFCSPPYDFYVDRADDMLKLLTTLMDKAPPESIFVVESDERFDPALLPDANAWDVREYPPARIALRK